MTWTVVNQAASAGDTIITKSGGTTSYNDNSGVWSQLFSAANPLTLQFKDPNSYDGCFIGLVLSGTTFTNFNDMSYSVQLANFAGTDYFQIYELGSLKLNVTRVASNFQRIQWDGAGVVTYYDNNVLKYTSLTTASGNYKVVTNLYNPASDIEDIGFTYTPPATPSGLLLTF